MIFSVEQGLFDLFPGLKIGALFCEIDNAKYGEDTLDAVIERTRKGFSYGKPQEHPSIVVWREAFKKLGISASKYNSSIESLLRRALKEGPFPRINPMVDLYNAISLKYLVPIGGHAMETIEGDIVLGFAKGIEPFIPMDSGTFEVVDKGEVVYKDSKEILTRRWVWRQCEKDKVTAGTRLVFIPIDVMEGLPDTLCEEVIKEFEECFGINRNGKILHKDILTQERQSTEVSL